MRRTTTAASHLHSAAIYNLLLFDNCNLFWQRSSRLKRDGLHPNRASSQMLAANMFYSILPNPASNIHHRHRFARSQADTPKDLCAFSSGSAINFTTLVCLGPSNIKPNESIIQTQGHASQHDPSQPIEPLKEDVIYYVFVQLVLPLLLFSGFKWFVI